MLWAQAMRSKQDWRRISATDTRGGVPARWTGNMRFVYASAVAYLYISRDRDVSPFPASDVQNLIEGTAVR